MPGSESLAPALCELAGIVDRVVPPGEGQVQHGSVYALRATAPSAPAHVLYTPVLCVVAQGGKEVIVGDARHVYDPGHFLVNSVPVPVPAVGRVIEASQARPCLWMSIVLDPALVGEVLAEVGGAEPRPPLAAMQASPLDGPLLDTVIRLARLFETPGDEPFMAPLVMREIVYRLLTGSQAARLRQAAPGPAAHPVALAVERVRLDFDKPLTIESLAREVGLSPSALHHHFKRVTHMTPLQYQRRMRLQEARRLMVGEGLDAARARAPGLRRPFLLQPRVPPLLRRPTPPSHRPRSERGRLDAPSSLAIFAKGGQRSAASLPRWSPMTEAPSPSGRASRPFPGRRVRSPALVAG